MLNSRTQLETARRQMAERLLDTPGVDWAQWGRLVLTAVAEAEADMRAAAMPVAGSDGVFAGRIGS